MVRRVRTKWDLMGKSKQRVATITKRSRKVRSEWISNSSRKRAKMVKRMPPHPNRSKWVGTFRQMVRTSQ